MLLFSFVDFLNILRIKFVFIYLFIYLFSSRVARSKDVVLVDIVVSFCCSLIVIRNFN